MPTEDNPKGLPSDGVTRGGPPVWPVLVLTFGAPRFLWRTDPSVSMLVRDYNNLLICALGIQRMKMTCKGITGSNNSLLCEL